MSPESGKIARSQLLIKCLYFFKHTKKDSKLGLSRAAFAKAVNTNRSTGSRWADAGEVLEQCRDIPTLLMGKVYHLAEIHSAPSQYWQLLTELLIEHDWTVKQTEAVVAST